MIVADAGHSVSIRTLPRYEAEALPLYRAEQYEQALPLFREFLATQGIDRKSEAALRARIVSCLRAIEERSGTGESGIGRTPEWAEIQGHFERYLDLLREHAVAIDTCGEAPWPKDPAGDMVRDVLTLAILRAQSPRRSAADAWERVHPRFQPIFLQSLQSSFEAVASDFELADRVTIAIDLGELYLELTSGNPSLARSRVAVRNRLADVVYFQSVSELDARTVRAIRLLEASLHEDPGNRPAQSMIEVIRQRSGVVLQIRRFGHDTESRWGGVRGTLDALRRRSDLPIDVREMVAILDRNLAHMLSIMKLVQKVVPARAAWVVRDPAEVCRLALEEERLPASCLSLEGVPGQWTMEESYLRVALQNLLRNSSEAYQRRGLSPHDPPVHLVLRYEDKRILVRDWAGGISAGLPDPFVPYVSEKGVQENVGLGLPQAREAIELQDGTLTLVEPQPDGGTEFCIHLIKG